MFVFQSGRSTKKPFHDLLPTIACSTPRTVSCRLAEQSGSSFIPLFSSYYPRFIPVIKFAVKSSPDPKDINPLFDAKEFRSPLFQRVYQYLKLSKEGRNMDNFTFVPGSIDDDQKTCLSLMLRSVKRRYSFDSTLRRYSLLMKYLQPNVQSCANLRQNHKSMLCVPL